MNILNIRCREYLLSTLCIATVLFSFIPNLSAQTQTDCPESYLSLTTSIPPVCVDFSTITDWSITTCTGSNTANAVMTRAFKEVIDIGFALHMIFVDEVVFPEIIRGLTKMAEQISVGHMNQSEILAKYADSQIEGDVIRRIQKNKIDALAETLPSEEHCKMITMTQDLISADNAGKREVWSNLGFLRNVSMSSKGSVSVAVDSDATIMEPICKYADRSGTVNALSEVCKSIIPDPDNAGKFLLANYVQDSTIGANDREPINVAMMNMFFSKPVPIVKAQDFELNDMKLAYMGHRSVLSRELLNTYCFQRTFEDKLGTMPMSSYQRESLKEMGMSDEYIDDKLGSNPSAYAQKKLLTDLAMSPKFSTELVDGKENILKLSHVLQSQKMASLYDTLEILHCNELILSQILNDELRPLRDDLQERIDTLLSVENDINRETDYVSNDIMYKLSEIRGGAK